MLHQVDPSRYLTLPTLDTRPLVPLLLLLLATPIAVGQGLDAERVEGAVIRILPPLGIVEGSTTIQTLAIDPEVATVTFYLDGTEVGRSKLPPFEEKLRLASPPREQLVRVEAYGPGGKLIGEDELVVNRTDPPFRVRIASLDGDPQAGEVRLHIDVSVPRKARLERIEVYRGEELVATLDGPSSAALTVPTPDVGPEDYVRVVASLEDGRSLEDVRLLAAPGVSETVDVHLVQLQVVVTDKRGYPVGDLEAADFEVFQNGERQQIEQLYPAPAVSLVLGLALDSSGSMGPLWRSTRQVTESFLDATLGPRDRTFLVDFDTRLRLVQPLTGDRREILAALDDLEPEGGTALYDSILFSVLQFDGEPGRRALIVFTDGFDVASRADPRRAVDFGRQLGVPVYIIALENGGGPGVGRGGPVASPLHLITDPTGGRLFRVLSVEQVQRAFALINAELRRQYVLLYYADEVPDPRKPPRVEVRQKGLRVKSVLGADQVQ